MPSVVPPNEEVAGGLDRAPIRFAPAPATISGTGTRGPPPAD